MKWLTIDHAIVIYHACSPHPSQTQFLPPMVSQDNNQIIHRDDDPYSIHCQHCFSTRNFIACTNQILLHVQINVHCILNIIIICL
mgnify:CR=1 FL=1